MIQLITREISLDQHVCELVFGVDVLDLDSWVQVDSILINQSRATLCCPQTHTTKLLDAKTGRLREHNQCYSITLVIP